MYTKHFYTILTFFFFIVTLILQKDSEVTIAWNVILQIKGKYI